MNDEHQEKCNELVRKLEKNTILTNEEKQTIKDLKEEFGKICKLSNNLKRQNKVLSQHQWAGIAIFIGMLVVTVLCGSSVTLLDAFDKPKAAVLIVSMLCWAGLAAIFLLFMGRVGNDGDQY